MKKIQRKAMIRIASAYRTTSTAALSVVTKKILIDLRVEERKMMYGVQGEVTPQLKK